AGRAEHGDLADVGVGGEQPERLPHLGEGVARDLEVEAVGVVAGQAEHGADDVGQHVPGAGGAGGGRQPAEGAAIHGAISLPRDQPAATQLVVADVIASPAGLVGSKWVVVHCSLNPAKGVEVETSSYTQEQKSSAWTATGRAGAKPSVQSAMNCA